MMVGSQLYIISVVGELGSMITRFYVEHTHTLRQNTSPHETKINKFRKITENGER